MADLSFDTFVDSLTQRLTLPLPGPDAHARMAVDSPARRYARPDARTRRSAVLLLFYPHGGELHLPLILRPAYDGVHSGQMAFPGGRYEAADEDLIRTAKREAQEEIGLRLTDVRVLGVLSELYIPPSNLFVLPVVAALPYRPEFFPDPREVEQVVEVPFREIADHRIVSTGEVCVSGTLMEAPYFFIQKYKVWGATAMMISELLAVVACPPTPAR